LYLFAEQYSTQYKITRHLQDISRLYEMGKLNFPALFRINSVTSQTNIDFCCYTKYLIQSSYIKHMNKCRSHISHIHRENAQRLKCELRTYMDVYPRHNIV